MAARAVGRAKLGRTAGIVTAMGQQGYYAGKRSLVTGAASGIGRATALRLATHGAELYLTDRDRDGLERNNFV